MIRQSVSAPYSQKKGSQVYSSIPPQDGNNYKKIKTALLQQYELTADGFRQKFRENQPEVGETVFQFVAWLRRFFTEGLIWQCVKNASMNYPTCSYVKISQYMCSRNGPISKTESTRIGGRNGDTGRAVHGTSRGNNRPKDHIKLPEAEN